MHDPNIEWPAQMLVIDLETTGLVAAQHGIVEAAMHHPASGKTATWLVDPRPCAIDPVALEINGTTLADLNHPGRVGVATFVAELWAWLATVAPRDGSKLVLCGRNPGFDRGMLDAATFVRLDEVKRAAFWKMISHRQLDVHGAMYVLAMARGWAWPVGAEKTEGLYARLGQQEEPRPHKAWNGVVQCLEALTLLVRAMRAPEGGGRTAEVGRQGEIAGDDPRLMRD